MCVCVPLHVPYLRKRTGTAIIAVVRSIRFNRNRYQMNQAAIAAVVLLLVMPAKIQTKICTKFDQRPIAKIPKYQN